MAVRGVIQYRRSPRGMGKHMPKAVKTANFETVEHWWEDMLPGHFKQSAMTFYGYQKRSKDYMKAKARFKKHQAPLVWKGIGKRAALESIKITGTSKQARGRLPGTSVFNLKSTVNAPDMRAELTALHPTEIQKLGRFHQKVLVRELNRFREHKTKRV